MQHCTKRPDAIAQIRGGTEVPQLSGCIRFYQEKGRVLIVVSIPPFESRVSGEGEPPVRRLGASVPVAGASGLDDQFQYWVVYFFNSVFLKWSTLFSAF